MAKALQQAYIQDGVANSNLPVLTRKNQLNSIIVDTKGKPDYLAINLYWDTFRSWYNTKIGYEKDGNVYHISKLGTKGIYLNYKKLAETHGCSQEAIRQKIVKLESLRLVHRSFQHRQTVTTKSYNQLIIYVWKETPYFYNNLGTDSEEILLKPQTNHAYIAKKHNKHFAENAPQEHAVLKGGGIQLGLDTKELNNFKSNKLDLDLTHARELNSNCNVINFNNSTCSKDSAKNTTTESVDNSVNKVSKEKSDVVSPLPKNFDELERGKGDFTISKTKKSEAVRVKMKKYYQKPKLLEDMLPVLTDTMCQEIIGKSGRFDFNSNYVRQLTQKLAKVSKHVHFFSLKGFIAYMSNRVKDELRDAVKCSSINFVLKCNIEDQEVRKEVGNELQNSPDLPDTFLGKVQAELIKICGKDGVNHYNNWFSKMVPAIDEQAKTFKLKASSEFATDWIKNNYWQQVKIAVSNFGFKLMEF